MVLDVRKGIDRLYGTILSMAPDPSRIQFVVGTVICLLKVSDRLNWVPDDVHALQGMQSLAVMMLRVLLEHKRRQRDGGTFDRSTQVFVGECSPPDSAFRWSSSDRINPSLKNSRVLLNSFLEQMLRPIYTRFQIV